MVVRRLLLALASLISVSACDVASPPEPPVAAESAPLVSRSAFVASAITAQNAGLPAAARAEKFADMATSAFAFYRGTDHLFWADNATAADLAIYGGADTWISGDLHVENMGSYGDDQGDVVFGMNDYDQAVVADYQMDVWRLATSLVLVGRQDGLGDSKIHDAVDLFTEAYLDQLDDDRKNDHEADRIFDASHTTGVLQTFVAHAAQSTRADLLAKWTVVTGGARTFDLTNPNLGPVSDATRAAVTAAIARYLPTLHNPLPASGFAVKAVAQRLHAGLGSLGTARYYVLVEGPSGASTDDVILDVKEESAPTAASYVATPRFASEAERVATGYRALDVDVDDDLGWTAIDGKAFVVRALSPFKDTLDEKKYQATADFKATAQQLGRVVATFHARGDQDFDTAFVPFDFEAVVHDLTNGQHDLFRALVWKHASSYADQVAKDWATFKKAFGPF
jgi:uncharacterized protein (DUF2252 family)